MGWLLYDTNGDMFSHRTSDVATLPLTIEQRTGMPRADYYCTQNGRLLASNFENIQPDVPIRICERIPGGKGGFGSMLRAIGAQIEKTTNREACRDLSGRRLRDINEEKRLKAYLDKQQEAGEDERAKAEKKIAKLLSKPKHEFEDEAYEHTRSELVVDADEALQEGLQKAIANAEQTSAGVGNDVKPAARKRKLPGGSGTNAKKSSTTLWLGADDMSSSSETDDESNSDTELKPQKALVAS